MTLNQFYDEYVRQHYKMSWNVFCAEYQRPMIDNLKKRLKKVFKDEEWASVPAPLRSGERPIKNIFEVVD